MKKVVYGDQKMKYLPDDLKREFDYFVRNYPDMPEIKHPLINLSDVFRAYFILIHYFTDSSSSDATEKMLPGIRSVDLLASALGRQMVSFGGRQKYHDPIDICATLFFGLVKNHSLNDGNKRTALLILLYQLQLFGFLPTAPKKDFEKLVLTVAASNLKEAYRGYYRKFKKHSDWEIQVISFALKKMVGKKDNSYHISPTMKEFCVALENQGVICTQENGKIRFSYTIPGKWLVMREIERNYSVIFGGWTRIVGAKTARDTLQALGLYEQFPSYQSLFDDSDPLYELVDNFSEPLRRLKDK